MSDCVVPIVVQLPFSCGRETWFVVTVHSLTLLTRLTPSVLTAERHGQRGTDQKRTSSRVRLSHPQRFGTC